MTRQDELRAIGAGDCPKHGRYYGICHSCAKDQDRQTTKEVWDRLIADNAAMLAEIDRLKNELAAACEHVERLCAEREKYRDIARASDRTIGLQPFATYEELVLQKLLDEWHVWGSSEATNGKL